MAENSENQSEEYPEELKVRATYALILVGMKYVKLDTQATNEIPLLPVNEAFKKDILSNIGVLLDLKVPAHGKPIDGITPPEIPPLENLRGLIELCGVPFEKQLTESDVNDTQSRLTITKDLVNEFINPLMNQEEYEGSMTVEGIRVTVYDAKGNQFPMKFKMWSQGKSQVLCAGWKIFCKDSEFKALEDWITIWVFRHAETRKLCFVILARRFPIKKLIPKIRKREREVMSWENRKRKEIERSD